MIFTQYLETSNPEWDRITHLIRQSYADSCIVEILKINNPFLNEKFNCHNNYPIIELFHGTSFEVCDSIIENGFKKELNKRSVYGNGNYFSCKASYSKQYMKSCDSRTIQYMFLVDVVLSPQTNKHNHIYVSSNNDDSLPKYLISFYTKFKKN